MRKFLFTIIGLELVTLLCVFGLNNYIERSYAATSYTVHNDEPLTLKNTISASLTSGIVFIGPYINGAYQTFQTTSGGILELSSAGRKAKELIYFSSASVDSSSTTKDVTLSGVVRGYCSLDRIDSQTFSSCESGRIWQKGTKGVLSPDMRLFNMTVKRDAISTAFNSGAYTSNQTNQPHILFKEVTTAERDAFTYEGVSGESYIVPNTTTGVMQYTMDNGATYIDFGSGSVINATEDTAGKIQLALIWQQRTGSGDVAIVGDTGARLVPAVSNFISTSSGSTHSGRLVTTNENGVFSVTVGGTGTGGTNMSSGAVFQTQGTQNLDPIYPVAGQFLGSGDGRSWNPMNPTVKNEAVVTAASGNVGASSVTINAVVPTWTGTGIDANTLAVGSTVKVHFGGDMTIGDQADDDLLFYVRVNDQECWDETVNALGPITSSSYSLAVTMNPRTIGASASI